MANLQTFFMKYVAVFLLLSFCRFVSAENNIYAVIDLPPYGCEAFDGSNCINTEFTQIAASAISGDKVDIQVFPYPRALSMFKSGQSKLLVALENKALLKNANYISLYSLDFYLVRLRNEGGSYGRTISYLRGAERLSEIADFADATKFEVNDYRQLLLMVNAGRLDYVLVPRCVFDDKISPLYPNAEVISSHSLNVYLYMNKSEQAFIERVQQNVLLHSADIIERHKYIFPE